MLRGMMVLLAIACIAGQGARAESPGPAGPPTGPWREQIHWVPMQDGGGHPRLLYTRICRPPGDQPARLVLINHGKPNDPDLPKVAPAACRNEAVQWFLARGYLVVAGVRRGYGATGGDFQEGIGTCGAKDLLRSAIEGARDIEAIQRYATALPYAKPDRVVVVGQSAGGWATDGYNSVPHPNVAAMVSMAGGNGGHVHGIANNNCRPDQLAFAAGLIGKTATTPMLWIYTANDSYFGPCVAAAMYEQFRVSGGKADFHQMPAFGDDGHALFFGTGGSAIWGPLMEAYLARQGLP